MSFEKWGVQARDSAHHIRLVAALIAAWVVVLLLRLCFRVYWKSWSNLPGPPHAEFFLGHLRSFGSQPNGSVSNAWFEDYGSTIQWRSFVSRPEIMTRDPAFVNAALHWPQFDRGRASPRLCRQMGAPHALAAVHKRDHRRLRKAMMPAFGAPAMRKLWPQMMETVGLMSRELAREHEKPNENDKSGQIVMSTDKWMALLTVELIHKCGFGDHPGCLETQQPSKLESVVRQMYAVPRGWIDILEEADLIPFVNLSKRQRNFRKTRLESNRESKQLLSRRQEEVLSSVSSDVRKEEFANNDLVSVLLRAQMSSDISDDWRITDDELVDQVKLLLFASTATMFSAMTWALHYLAVDERVQSKLRTEIAVMSDTPSWEEVDRLPYLDAVVKEATRLWSSVESLERMVTEKVVVPLSRPVTGRDGRLITQLTLDAGTAVRLPMVNVNSDPLTYGEDATRFQPERHLDDRKLAGGQLGGTWGSHISFSGGPQGCIGYRFGVAEIKALLFVLIRTYRLSEPEGQSVQRIGAITGTKTKVRPRPDEGIEGIPIILTPLDTPDSGEGRPLSS